MFGGKEPWCSHILVLLIYLLAVKFFYVVDNDLWMDLCLIKIQDIDTVLIRHIPGIHVDRLSVLFSGLLASIEHVSWGVEEIFSVAHISRNLKIGTLFSMLDTSHAIDTG